MLILMLPFGAVSKSSSQFTYADLTDHINSQTASKVCRKKKSPFIEKMWREFFSSKIFAARRHLIRANPDGLNAAGPQLCPAAECLFGPLKDERGDFLAKIFSVWHPNGLALKANCDAKIFRAKKSTVSARGGRTCDSPQSGSAPTNKQS